MRHQALPKKPQPEQSAEELEGAANDHRTSIFIHCPTSGEGERDLNVTSAGGLGAVAEACDRV